MKILIATGIYPPDVGGPATYSALLEKELPKRGVEVKVITYGKLKNYTWILRQPAYFFSIFLVTRNVDIIYAQDILNSGISSYVTASIWRKKLLLKIVGDYAWEQGAQRFGVKEVLDDFLDRQYGFMVECFRFLEKFVAGRADKIIVPSEYLKKVVIKWGIDPKKITVIYNSFNAPELNLSKEDARHKLRLSGKILVSAGRDVPWKGFQTLRGLMPEISEKIPEAKLFILVNESKEKLMLYLKSADVFVLNTAYEGFSHQILEAMTMGCPVVTTDVGGNPELINDGESGYLVKFNDKNGLKSKILEILNNIQLAQKLAQNAQKKAGEFSKERMINETINLIKNICEF